MKNLDDTTHSSLLALYSSVQNDIAYYRGWEWNITAIYGLLTTGIIGFVTNDNITPFLYNWHRGVLTGIQILAIIFGFFHLYKMHHYLTENRLLRNKIERSLGFFEKGKFIENEQLLSKAMNKRKSFFNFEFWDFIVPFALFLLLYELSALYLIWKL